MCVPVKAYHDSQYLPDISSTIRMCSKLVIYEERTWYVLYIVSYEPRTVQIVVISYTVMSMESTKSTKKNNKTERNGFEEKICAACLDFIEAAAAAVVVGQVPVAGYVVVW